MYCLRSSFTLKGAIMDKKMQEQSQSWTQKDCHQFYQRFFKKSFEGTVPALPFTSEQLYGMRADSYQRGYRAGYLRFLPSLTVAQLDTVYKLQHTAVLRENAAFRSVSTGEAGWACFMPAPFNVTKVIQTVMQMDGILDGLADQYRMRSGEVALPNVAELMFLFLMETVYDASWPHGRIISAISSTVINDQRLGLQVVSDGRMRLGLTFMPVHGPFEGDILPIARYSSAKRIA
ncbi:hypothetical protein IT408_04130 [Candidatus Uhrbacteria bacterium]|nr:hypothetical protein [Candidatus Uhrbacteria bacterium]